MTHQHLILHFKACKSVAIIDRSVNQSINQSIYLFENPHLEIPPPDIEQVNNYILI
jgi:hypothetical protein